MTGLLEAVHGDVTLQAVDAIVNAANQALSGGGGVDGAIHRAAGPGLAEECSTIGRCPTGQAVATGGYNLPSRFIFHTPAPAWQGGSRSEQALLRQCYRSCFALCEIHGVRTIAFPSIGTGAYRVPVEVSARIAVDESLTAVAKQSQLALVRFVCFTPKDLRVYRRVLAMKQS